MLGKVRVVGDGKRFRDARRQIAVGDAPPAGLAFALIVAIDFAASADSGSISAMLGVGWFIWHLMNYER